MSIDNQKRMAAEAAIEYIENGNIIGVGTGSTTNYFIDALYDRRHDIEGAVASSIATEERLKKVGIPLVELNQAGTLSLYVDGADEVNAHKQLIKGGGGALTREKVVAAASNKFLCIADDSKLVDLLGEFPLPVEVIPMARSYVARQLIKLGGQPSLRDNFVTDNGNVILDAHHLKIHEPINMESTINQIAGVVTVGLFAARPADVILLGTDSGVKKL